MRRTAKPVRVAFQGELGAFSQKAVVQLLGEKAVPVPYPRFEEAFRALVDSKVDSAVIPIENTLAGSVAENYDHLLNFDVQIVAETSVRIVHNLIAVKGVRPADIRRVYSHPVALAQCLNFFASHPAYERAPFYDTAGSVKMLVEQNLRDAAAIASDIAAAEYGAEILRKSIEDDRRNFTRFFLLHRTPRRPIENARTTPARMPTHPLRAAQPPADRGPFKTSVVFTTRNVPGALFRSLSAFALRDISLAKIESRPLRGKPWEYLFYLDFLGSVEEERVQKALGHLTELADMLRVLGCYPKAF